MAESKKIQGNNARKFCLKSTLGEEHEKNNLQKSVTDDAMAKQSK